MRLTVREILKMIDNKELCYDQTTQREFLYNNKDRIVHVKNAYTDQDMTKSGALINAILEDKIQLPALYFWKNKGSNTYNLHDGKQRVLSIKNFIETNDVTTFIKNRSYCSIDCLEPNYKSELLNYMFDIVVREGTKEEEERSFYLINKSSLPLTDYECLRGMYYGDFISGFEKYINALASNNDGIKKIDRGDQAYKIFKLLFVSETETGNSLQLIQDRLKIRRADEFSPQSFELDKMLDIFTKFHHIKDSKNKLITISEDIMFDLSRFIVKERYYDEYKDEIIDLYSEAALHPNDISSWKIDTHKTFIKAKITRRITLDPMRNFSKNDKNELFKQKTWELSYEQYEVDHIYPWSQGGKTNLTNAQLLNKQANASKGDTIPTNLEHEVGYYLYNQIKGQC